MAKEGEKESDVERLNRSMLEAESNERSPSTNRIEGGSSVLTDFYLDEARPDTDPTQAVIKRREVSSSHTPRETFFTYVKALVAIGILYIPKGFAHGGWAFSIGIYVLCGTLATIGLNKLVETHRKVGGGYPRLAKKTCGICGKLFVELAIVFTQFNYVTAYSVFMTTDVYNISVAMNQRIPYFVLGIIWAIILVPMMLVRDVTIYASCHTFADIIIFVTLFIVPVFAIMNIHHNGVHETVEAYTEFEKAMRLIGIAMGGYEVNANVIPIYKQAGAKEKYHCIQTVALVSCSVIYIIFGVICYLSFGKPVLAPVTLSIKADAIMAIVEMAYVVALFPSSVLQMFPAVQILEHYIAKPIQSASRREFCRNAMRIVLILASIFVAVFFGEQYERVFSLVGNLAAAPLCYFFPGLLHLMLTRPRGLSLIADIVLIAAGAYCFTIATLLSVISWD